MLHTNAPQRVEIRKVGEYDIHLVKIGEKGRGRRELNLVVPASLSGLKEKNINLTIGKTSSGNPRIVYQVAGEKEEVYLLLQSYGGYTRRGDGHIIHNCTEVAYGNGADGEAGNIGYWDCKLLHIENGQSACVQYSGGAPVHHQYFFMSGNRLYVSPPVEPGSTELAAWLEASVALTPDQENILMQGDFYEYLRQEKLNQVALNPVIVEV